MNDEELLKRRILEFELELKMSHIEYGLPIVEVVNGDGSNLDISPVYEHLNAPKSSDERPKNIVSEIKFFIVYPKLSYYI